ncbi:MAG: chemotaxis protein CheA [Bacteroidetes bacterium]|nr:MAG: chemotaxis protein CheA [Bacteroidota bacterium]
MEASMDNFKRKFVEEAYELIDELEKAVLELEEDHENPDLVQRVFRIMHTLKGNSSMFGFEEIDRFTHHMETIYDLIRSGDREVTPMTMEVTLRSVDHLRNLLDEAGRESEQLMAQQEGLMHQMDEIIDGNESEVSPAVAADAPMVEQPLVTESEEGEAAERETFFIRFTPVSDIFNNGTNPLYQIDELRALGDCRVRVNMEAVPPLDVIDPQFCYTSWEVVLSTSQGRNAIDDVFIFVEGDAEIEVELVDGSDLLSNRRFLVSLEKLWATHPRVTVDQVKGAIPEQVVVEALPQEESAARQNSKNMAISSIRVASEKLDELMNLVSELVTTQARLTLFAEESNQPGLTSISENVQKLSRQLRDIAFSIVLIPIENLVTRFHRLVRDLSKNLKKDVRFVTEGTDTELDKTIIEGLADPLLHILRNSLDHGIEDAATRERAGKPKQGTILLKAFYSGTNVLVQVSDDGRGIDPAAIQAKAVERGIIAADRKLSKRETLDLLFLPGFSTAEEVSDVSGRGVGMDVVKRKIMELRGEVELESELGVGTTITIKMPLTLSIIDGLLVKVADTSYVIPLSAVDKIYAVEHTRVIDQFNDLVVLDGVQIPYFNLRREFKLPEFPDVMEQVVVVHYEERKVGFVVDTVIGEYQAVLKPLSKHYKNQDMISGATILGDGTVALVMDTNRIVKHFTKENEFVMGGVHEGGEE